MKLGLLGAIGGLGQALTTAGKDLATRREQALERARQDAAEQRRRAQQVEDREDQQTFQTGQSEITQAALDRRNEAAIKARQQEGELNRKDKQADREFRTTERIEGQKYRTSERVASQGDRRELARLQSSLQGSRSEAEIRLRDKLSADDVHAVQYGAPDANGYADVYVVLKGGGTRKTGQKFYRPAKDKEEEGEAL